MGFWKLATLFSLVPPMGCVVGGVTDIGDSPDASTTRDNGNSAPVAWALNSKDFTRPWIRLPVPTGSLESVISLTPDAQGYAALVRYDNSVGKVIGTVTHRLALSSDGVNWASRDFDSIQDPSQGAKYFQAAAFGGGRYVVVGNAGFSSLLRVSSNGLAWTSVATEGGGLSCATYAGGRWFAGGVIGYLATSLDGLAWSTQKLEDGSINAVAYGNGVYVAAGNVAFWVSSGGQSWEPISIICDSADGCPGATPPDSTFPQPAIVAVDRIFFAEQRFFAGSSSSGYNFISVDGRGWQVIPPGQLATNPYVGKQYLAITPDSVVQGSADGTNWTLRTTLTDDNPEGRSCALNRCFAWKQNVILVPSG